MITKKDGLMISTLINKMQSLQRCSDDFKEKSEYLNALFFLDSLKVELTLAKKYNINLLANKNIKDRVNELEDDLIPSIQRWVDLMDRKAA
jgi:hypothetical protein